MSTRLEFKLSDDLSLIEVHLGKEEELFQLVDKNRAHLREWMPWVDSTKSSHDTKDFIERSMKIKKENKSFNCFMLYRDKIVGVVGFHEQDASNKRVAMGYWIDKDHQGKGIVTKSVKCLMDYAFSEWKLNRIEIYCAPENEKSAAVPKRLGFKQEGVIRQREWLYDHFVDHVVYGILICDVAVGAAFK